MPRAHRSARPPPPSVSLQAPPTGEGGVASFSRSSFSSAPSIPSTPSIPSLLDGDRRAVARALTVAESGGPEADALVDALYPHTGRAWRIGITGPPGAGKSTLTDRLIGHYRAQGERVAVVAVDPSSPFTGGALLGDRVRMDAHTLDPGVFIRSLAARGALGGLSEATEAACDVLDAAGYGVILIETVGVGQGEIDVAEAADTVLVVLVPESGDAVQAMKAGLMEIADVFAVNKADHPEAGLMARALRQTLHLRPAPADGWTVPVVTTSAARGDGLGALTDALDRHRRHLAADWERLRDARLRRRVQRLVEAAWQRRFWTDERRRALADALDALASEERAPYRIAARLLAEGTAKGMGRNTE